MARRTVTTAMLLFLLVAVSVPAAAQDQQQPNWRTWTDIDGREIVAEFVQLDEGVVHLKKADDQKTYRVGIDRLSPEDQQYVREQHEPGASAAFPIGDALPDLEVGEQEGDIQPIDTTPRRGGIFVTGVGLDPARAEQDAFTKAIEQTVGILIESEVVIKDDELLKEVFRGVTRGYVETFEILRRYQKEGLHHVDVWAKVALSKLAGKLDPTGSAEQRIDGLRIVLEREFKRKNEENAARMFAHRMNDFAADKLLTPEIMGEPEDLGSTATHMKLRIRTKLTADMDKWEQFVEGLSPLLSAVATKGCRYYYKAKRVTSDGYHVRHHRVRQFLSRQLNAALDDEHGVRVDVFAALKGIKTEWIGCRLPESFTTVANAAVQRKYFLSYVLLDAQGNVVTRARGRTTPDEVRKGRGGSGAGYPSGARGRRGPGYPSGGFRGFERTPYATFSMGDRPHENHYSFNCLFWRPVDSHFAVPGGWMKIPGYSPAAVFDEIIEVELNELRKVAKCKVVIAQVEADQPSGPADAPQKDSAEMPAPGYEGYPGSGRPSRYDAQPESSAPTDPADEGTGVLPAPRSVDLGEGYNKARDLTDQGDELMRKNDVSHDQKEFGPCERFAKDAEGCYESVLRAAGWSPGEPIPSGTEEVGEKAAYSVFCQGWCAFHQGDKDRAKRLMREGAAKYQHTRGAGRLKYMGEFAGDWVTARIWNHSEFKNAPNFDYSLPRRSASQERATLPEVPHVAEENDPDVARDLASGMEQDTLLRLGGTDMNWQVVTGKWVFDGPSARVTGSPAYSTPDFYGCVALGGIDATDYVFRARLRPLTREYHDFGLVFRAIDKDNFYYLGLCSVYEPPYIQIRRKGKWEPPITSKHPGDLSDARVEVHLRGPRIRAYFDGELVMDVTDSTFDHGRIGLRAFAPTDGMFEDVEQLIAHPQQRGGIGSPGEHKQPTGRASTIEVLLSEAKAARRDGRKGDARAGFEKAIRLFQEDEAIQGEPALRARIEQAEGALRAMTKWQEGMDLAAAGKFEQAWWALMDCYFAEPSGAGAPHALYCAGLHTKAVDKEKTSKAWAILLEQFSRPAPDGAWKIDESKIREARQWLAAYNPAMEAASPGATAPEASEY